MAQKKKQDASIDERSPNAETTAPTVDYFEFGTTRAHELFRTDPFSRLLMLVGIKKIELRGRAILGGRFAQAGEDVVEDEPESMFASMLTPPGSTNEAEMAVDYVSHLSEMCEYFHRDPDERTPKELAAGRAFVTSLCERNRRGDLDGFPTPEELKETETATIQWVKEIRKRVHHGGVPEDRWIPFPRKALEGYLRIARVLAAELQRSKLSNLTGEETDNLLLAGRSALCEWIGVEPEGLDELSSDPNLCEALCRVAFNGPTELDLTPGTSPMRGGSALIHSIRLPTLAAHARIDRTPLPYLFDGSVAEPILRLSHPPHHSGSLETLATLFQALAASPERKAAVREAILTATSTAGHGSPSAWKRIGPCGDLPTAAARKAKGPKSSRQRAEDRDEMDHDLSAHGRRAFYETALHPETTRILGAAARGDAFRASLGQLESIVQWRNPASVKARSLYAYGGPFHGIWEEGLGAASAEAIRQEAHAHRFGIGETLSEAISLQVRHPDAKAEIAIAMARRIAEGFSSLGGEPTTEQLFPGLLDEIEQIEDARRSSAPDPETEALWKAAEARVADDPMSKVATKAAKAFGKTPRNPDSFVGEAKRVLLEETGLSNAAWKALCSNPELRGLFEKALSNSGELSRKSDGRARAKPVKRRAEDVMRDADAKGEAFAVRLRVRIRKEIKTTPAIGAGRALSACAMGGVSAEAQGRLLELLADLPAATSLLSGIVPVQPGSNVRGRGQPEDCIPRRLENGPGAEFHKWADSFAEEAQALSALAPTIALGFSKLVEKTRSSHPDGADSANARAAAKQAVNALISDIRDVAASEPVGFWGTLDKADPIGHAKRQHQRWVERLRNEEAAANPKLATRWLPEIGSLHVGRIHFRELHDGQALHEEGSAMSHCVASYVDACSSGKSRIFSVSIDGLRHATLELAPHTATGTRIERGFNPTGVGEREKISQWKCVQNRGRHNSQISNSEVLEACEAFSLSFSKQFARNTSELKAQRDAEAKAKAAAKPPKP